MTQSKLTLLSLAFLMGTAMSLSADPVDPSQNTAGPATDRAQPTMDDVAWSGGHFPGTVMVPRGLMKPAMPHAVGAIAVPNVARKTLDTTKPVGAVGGCPPGEC